VPRRIVLIVERHGVRDGARLQGRTRAARVSLIVPGFCALPHIALIPPLPPGAFLSGGIKYFLDCVWYRTSDGSEEMGLWTPSR
jgi:hypothetical protein